MNLIPQDKNILEKSYLDAVIQMLDNASLWAYRKTTRVFFSNFPVGAFRSATKQLPDWMSSNCKR